MRSQRLTWAAGALATAAVLSGCTSAVTGTAAPAAAELPPAAAQLHDARLRLADLPAGWSAEAAPGPDQQTMQLVATCLGARDSWKDVAAVTASPGFDDAGGDRIGEFTASFHAHRDVDGDTALLRDSRAAACFARAFSPAEAGASVPADQTVGAADFTITPGAGGGPSNIAGVAVGTLPVSRAGGGSTTIHIEFVLITGRLTEAQLFFLSAGQPLPADLRGKAIAAVAQRVAAL